MSEWHTDRQIGLTASEIFSALIYSLKNGFKIADYTGSYTY